jgi:hypothetical protein
VQGGLSRRPAGELRNTHTECCFFAAAKAPSVLDRLFQDPTNITQGYSGITNYHSTVRMDGGIVIFGKPVMAVKITGNYRINGVEKINPGNPGFFGAWKLHKPEVYLESCQSKRG